MKAVAGRAPEGAFTGAAGGAACGDLARISLVVEPGDRRGELRHRGMWGYPGRDRGRRRAGRWGGRARCRRSRGRGDRRGGRGLDAAKRTRPARRRCAAPGVRAGGGLHCSDWRRRAGTGSGGDVRRGRQRCRRRSLERERGAEVIAVTVKLWADPETDGAKACCSPEAVLGARAARPLARHPSLHPRPRGGLPPPRRRRLRLRLRGGQTPNPCILCNGEVRIAAMLDLAERLGATAPRHRPLRADRRGRRGAAAGRRRRRRQGPELHARGAAAGPARAARLPAHRADQARGARDRRPPRARGRPQDPRVRTSASSPARASGASCAATAACVEREGAVLDRSGEAIGRHRGHHNFTVGQRRGIGVSRQRAALRPRHRRRRNTVTVGTREELETRTDAASATRSSTATAPASTRSGSAITRALPARLGERRRRAATMPSRSSSPRPLTPPRRARPRCCWPARRSSATARSPPRPERHTERRPAELLGSP